MIKGALKIMKNWIQKHFLITAVIICVASAVIIHIFYSIQAPVSFLESKWGAGEILTFFSTAFLGVLALWQNRKQSEENEKAQNRLMDLSRQSNELAIISKIIEYENGNLQRLRKAYDNFENACDSQKIVNMVFTNETNPIQIVKELSDIEKCLQASFSELTRELRIDQSLIESNNPTTQSIANYYTFIWETISVLSHSQKDEEDIKKFLQAIEKSQKPRNDYLKYKEQYDYSGAAEPLVRTLRATCPDVRSHLGF